MAGRPLRRLRQEIARQQQGEAPQIPEVPRPAKPVAEMTPAELDEHRARVRKFLRELKRPQREAALRAGRVKPRTMAEAEIFGSDLLGRRPGRDDKGRR